MDKCATVIFTIVLLKSCYAIDAHESRNKSTTNKFGRLLLNFREERQKSKQQKRQYDGTHNLDLGLYLPEFTQLKFAEPLEFMKEFLHCFYQLQ